MEKDAGAIIYSTLVKRCHDGASQRADVIWEVALAELKSGSKVIFSALPMWRPPCSDVGSSRARAAVPTPSTAQQHLLGICCEWEVRQDLPVLKLYSILHCFFSKLITLCMLHSQKTYDCIITHWLRHVQFVYFNRKYGH